MDGNDVESIYGATSSKVDEIRQGKGPQFIECSTYRWREHCGPNFDNHIGYRSESEYERWRKLDPIVRCEDALFDRCILTRNVLKQIRDDFEAEFLEAYQFAEESPFPEIEDIKNYVYA